MWLKTYLNRFKRKNAYWGKLGRNVVQCRKKVMVFDYPNIVMEAETVEEATDFFTRERVNRRLEFAGIYKHEQDSWKEVPLPQPESFINSIPEPPPQVA